MVSNAQDTSRYAPDVYVNVNEEGEPYGFHFTEAAALAVQREFPNDTVVRYVPASDATSHDEYRVLLSSGAWQFYTSRVRAEAAAHGTDAKIQRRTVTEWEDA